MRRVQKHPDGGWVALTRYGSIIAITQARAAAWKAVHAISAGEEARKAADDLCEHCGGVGRRLVRGPRRLHNGRVASIITCPDCKGSGKGQVDIDQVIRRYCEERGIKVPDTRGKSP